ncbi:hypothetical protein GUJ93_ZPchr0012g19733 [Zizania palustris]|uniref:Uncharacterized protein n=1 Tax=Zizania palustris TaxID=103762 RepID=A0A8J5WIR5_ZIZPA|nr:hypothetical protein GUJ93_ZPchr0012g19733 [Zizania palustris]
MIYYPDNLKCKDIIADLKKEFLVALDLYDKDVDAGITKINEAHKEIENAQQKIVTQIKTIFGSPTVSSLPTESPCEARCKRRAKRPVGYGSPNAKRKSKVPRDVSLAHIDVSDDGPRIVVKDLSQSAVGQSTSVQQEAAPPAIATSVQQKAVHSVADASIQ